MHSPVTIKMHFQQLKQHNTALFFLFAVNIPIHNSMKTNWAL